jgi:quinol monooxygenase YgiN
MAEDTLRVIVRLKARPDKVNDLKSVFRSLVESTCKEPGCLGYKFLQNNEDPTDFTLVEEWKNESALELHFATKHFKDASANMPNFLSAEPDVRRYHLVS